MHEVEGGEWRKGGGAAVTRRVPLMELALI